MDGVEQGKRPVCKLVGEDGNVFNVIGRVQKALIKAGMEDKAKEFGAEATSGKYDYDGVLALCFSYVEVE